MRGAVFLTTNDFKNYVGYMDYNLLRTVESVYYDAIYNDIPGKTIPTSNVFGWLIRTYKLFFFVIRLQRSEFLDPLKTVISEFDGIYKYKLL